MLYTYFLYVTRAYDFVYHVFRPETPVTKATTFLQTMLRKEVNSQLSLGDPLFPELAEESLKTFEQVTEDCNENPEKDVLAELGKSVDMYVIYTNLHGTWIYLCMSDRVKINSCM